MCFIRIDIVTVVIFIISARVKVRVIFIIVGWIDIGIDFGVLIIAIVISICIWPDDIMGVNTCIMVIDSVFVIYVQTI